MIVSGMSDHDVVAIKANIKPSIHKQTKINFLLCKNADWNAICTGFQPLMDEMRINSTSVSHLDVSHLDVNGMGEQF